MMDATPTMESVSSPAVAPGRSCGKCSMCCKLLHIIELNKPSNKWCEHCRPGYGGCSIYETRPSICRSFLCGWMQSEQVGPEWYPLLSHMILSFAPFNGVMTLTCCVDPNHPNIWKEHPYYTQLKQFAYHGLHVKKADEIRFVHVRCNGRVWLLTDEEDIEVTHGSYIVKLEASGRYGIELFASQEQAAERVIALLNESNIEVPPT